MCGILAVLGCSDDSQAKRTRVLELSRRHSLFLPFTLKLSSLLTIIILSYITIGTTIMCVCVRILFVTKGDHFEVTKKDVGSEERM